MVFSVRGTHGHGFWNAGRRRFTRVSVFIPSRYRRGNSRCDHVFDRGVSGSTEAAANGHIGDGRSFSPKMVLNHPVDAGNNSTPATGALAIQDTNSDQVNISSDTIAGA